MRDEIVIAPVRRSRLSHQIIVQLSRMIREGQLRAGDRLPAERELAKRLDVSRTSLREALRVLEQSGVIATRQGGGTYVRDTSEESGFSPLTLVLDHSDDIVGDLWEVRAIFEPSIAARAAVRATTQHLVDLDEIVAKQRTLLNQNVPHATWLDSDRAFHVAIARASHNVVAIRVIHLINQLLNDSRGHFAASTERREHAVTCHDNIRLAIHERNPQQARESMQEHLREVEEYIIGSVMTGSPDDGR